MAAVPLVDAGIIFNTCVHGRQYVVRGFAVARVLFLIPAILKGIHLFDAGIIFNTHTIGSRHNGGGAFR